MNWGNLCLSLRRRPQENALPPSAPASATADASSTPEIDNRFLSPISPGRRDWLLLAALVVAVFLVYQPAWRGGFLWDDDAHITRPELRSWDGLRRIWCEWGATQQYYPLLHSFFWLQCQLWGESPLGYHLVNIALHALAAVLVALLLRRLGVPGALLAAAIFALHPVQVESVAWITEQKNTLSAVFYLAAALAYLRFDRTRTSPSPAVPRPSPLAPPPSPLAPRPSPLRGSRRWYAAALVLFVLGLLSKTVTATLPVALLVVLWWRRGKLSWRRDVLPLVPLFLLGAAAGCLTAAVEQQMICTTAADYEYAFSLLERCLIAGRVFWFYLGKLLWPAELIFIYPRWDINATLVWQYLFPLGALLLLALLWAVRHRWRAPLAGLLFFAGTLLPVLGFLNVYPFRYSWVADHFQYLASLGVFTLLAAGATLLFRQGNRWSKAAAATACLALLAAMAALSFRQIAMYRDIETLYDTTIERNPTCWMAHNNLAIILAGRGRIDEAIKHYLTVLRLNPKHAEAHNNLGDALALQHKTTEAIEHYQEALRLKPDHVEAHNNFATTLVGMGRTAEAIAHYREALRLNPRFAGAHNNLGNCLLAAGRCQEAIEHYREAVRLNPHDVNAQNNLGVAATRLGNTAEAIEHYREALRLSPHEAEAHINLGMLLAARGETGEAIEHFQQVLQRKPGLASVRCQLANALAATGKVGEAVEQYDGALQSAPRSLEALNNLAWLLATHDPAEHGDAARAVELAQQARRLMGQENAPCLDTLAASYAAAGRFGDAVLIAEQAVQLATAAGQTALAEKIGSRLQLYRAGQPYRETVRSSRRSKR